MLSTAASAPPANATATDTVTLTSQTSVVPQDMQANFANNITPAKAQEILQRDPFTPKNINFFSTKVYPDATPMEPAAAPEKPLTEDQLQNKIAKTLLNRAHIQNKETPNGQPKVNPKTFAQQGLDLFKDPALQGVDPRLRTFYAILPGTSLEGAMASFKEGVINGTSSYRFGPLTNPLGIAQTIVHEDGTREVVFNEIYQHEDPQQWAPFAGHEELHRDPVMDTSDGEDQKEELIAQAFTNLTHLQFLKEDPKMALQGTELARRNNSLDMALINTRDDNGNIHILDTLRGLPVFPNSIDSRTYYGQTWVDAGLGPDTPGNDVLDHAIAVLEHSQMEDTLNFDDSTLQRLDADVNNAYSPGQWLRFAKALQLNVPGFRN